MCLALNITFTEPPQSEDTYSGDLDESREIKHTQGEFLRHQGEKCNMDINCLHKGCIK